MWLFLIFLAVPLIEIGLFIQVGGAIGLLPTLVIVILTALLGTALVRQQGIAVLNDLRRSLDTFDDPARPLVHGALILFAGALLLTPGFFTDAVGLSLLVPPVRDMAYDLVRRRIAVQRYRAEATASARRRPDDPTVIDGEFEDLGDLPPRRPPNRRP